MNRHSPRIPNHRVLLGVLVLWPIGLDASAAAGQVVPNSGSYQIESLRGPDGVDDQVGALGVLSDGRLVVGFHRGEVYFYDPESEKWNVFARGLHEPLGLVALSPQEVLVMQRPELTRLRDTDADGTTDRYETVWDGFGMTGNYHEFAYGPLLDRAGGLFVSLNLGSTGDGVREEIRGPWAPFGPSHQEFLHDWEVIKPRLAKMYSRVPWRGWVMRLEAGWTEPAIPWSNGWRSPDGLGFDQAGRLLVTDNQGDWVGTSGLWVSGRGHFAGHPASRIWEPGVDADPDMHDPVPHAARRTPAAVLLPHGLMASSPTQPLCDTTGGAFGPFSGQVFIGEMNSPRLLRVMMEDVNGVAQGAATPFLDWAGLRAGNHRLAWTPDGSLIVGQTHLAWAGGSGLQRVKWTGRTPMAVVGVSLQRGGFLLRFTLPAVDPPPLEAWKIRRYGYAYHADYGSPQLGLAAVVPAAVEWRDKGSTAWVELGDIQAGGTVYEFTLPVLRSHDGAALDQRLVCYTVNALP